MSGYDDEIVEDKGELGLGLDSDIGLRHRIPWSDRVSLSSEVPGLHEVKELLEDDDASCLAEEEDGVGCPLPSTPEDDHLLDCEVRIHFFFHQNVSTQHLFPPPVKNLVSVLQTDDRGLESWSSQRRDRLGCSRPQRG